MQQHIQNTIYNAQHHMERHTTYLASITTTVNEMKTSSRATQHKHSNTCNSTPKTIYNAQHHRTQHGASYLASITTMNEMKTSSRATHNLHTSPPLHKIYTTFHVKRIISSSTACRRRISLITLLPSPTPTYTSI